jgi:hypothetical protein
MLEPVARVSALNEVRLVPTMPSYTCCFEDFEVTVVVNHSLGGEYRRDHSEESRTASFQARGRQEEH